MEITLQEALGEDDWERLAELFERAPLGRRDAGKLRRAFARSYARCFAFRGAELVGAARAISDGEYYAAIYDVVVLPQYQRRGVGRMMMEYLLERLPVGQVLLVSVPGKEEFYRKLQFRRNKTAMTRHADAEKYAADGYTE